MSELTAGESLRITALGHAVTLAHVRTTSHPMGQAPDSDEVVAEAKAFEAFLKAESRG